MLTKPFPWICLLGAAAAAQEMVSNKACDETDPTSLLQMGGLRATPAGPAIPVPSVVVPAVPAPVGSVGNDLELHFLDSADPMPWEGLSSTDFTPAGDTGGGKAHTSSESMDKDWLLVYALILLMLLAISPIVARQGVWAVILVAAYLASLTLVKLLVKRTITLGFPYPDSITALHMSAISLVACTFERPHREEAWVVLPISLVRGFSLLANNTALLYGGVAFVSMIHANVPFFTFSYELMKGRRGVDLRSAAAVLLVCVGSAFCISGEDSLSMTKASSLPLAIGFATASAMLRSVRGVWQEELVCESLTPMRLVFWNGIWSLLISIPLAAFSEGFKALPQLYMVSFEAKMALLGSTVAGVLLNITQVLAVKELGALMQSIVGNLNLILVIALSQAWLHEEVALFQHFGIILLATGTFVNHVEPKKKAEMEMDQRFREALRIISAASPRSCLTPVGISNDAVASER